MKSRTATIIIFTALFSTAAVVSADDSHQKTSSTDSSGTTVTTEKDTKSRTGMLGTQKSESDENTEVDPKGMFNSKTTSMHEEESSGPGDNRSHSKRSIDAAGTSHEDTTEKSVSKHWTDSGDTTTTKSLHEVDPKGLGNKQSAEVDEKVDRAPNGSTKKTVTKKVNGREVSETTTDSRQ